MDPAKVARMCGTKARFNRREAERRAFWRGMRAYPCPVCGRWHLTTLNAPLGRKA